MRVNTADLADLASKLAVAVAPTILLVLFGSGGLFALQRHRRATGGKTDARKGFEERVTEDVTALQDADTGHRRFESTLMKQYQDLSDQLDEARAHFNDRFADAEQRHVADILKLKAEHKADIARLEREHATALAVLKEAHATAIRDMEKRHAAAIEERDRTIASLRQRIAHLEQVEVGKVGKGHAAPRGHRPLPRGRPPGAAGADAEHEDY